LYPKDLWPGLNTVINPWVRVLYLYFKIVKSEHGINCILCSYWVFYKIVKSEHGINCILCSYWVFYKIVKSEHGINCILCSYWVFYKIVKSEHGINCILCSYYVFYKIVKSEQGINCILCSYYVFYKIVLIGCFRVWALKLYSEFSGPAWFTLMFEPCSWRGVLDTTLCDKACQWLAAGRWFSLGNPVSSTNKTEHHDITEILLKVVLNTINL
jgi:DNA-directed RNA polymerase subunit RPC12/RpoP